MEYNIDLELKFASLMRLGERNKIRRTEAVRFWGNDFGGLNWSEFTFTGLSNTGWDEYEGLTFLGIWKWDTNDEMLITPAVGIGRVYISVGLGYVDPNAVVLV